MIFSLRSTLFLCLLSISLIACQSNSASDSAGSSNGKYALLSAQEFKTAIDQNKDIQLIDVRTPEEIAQGSIDGALHLNFHEDSFQEKLLQLDRQKPTYVYCRSGGRSGKTLKLLKKSGFQEAYDLDGGYTAWKAAFSK